MVKEEEENNQLVERSTNSLRGICERSDLRDDARGSEDQRARGSRTKRELMTSSCE